MRLADTKHPVARLVVAPIGVGNAVLWCIAVVNIVDCERSRHVERHGLHILWQGIEDHVDIQFAQLRNGDPSVEGIVPDALHLIIFSVSLQHRLT